MLPIYSTVTSSLRFSVSATATAVICDGFIADLVMGKILSPDSLYLAKNKNKLQRARWYVITEVKKEEDQKVKKNPIRGIYFYSWKDTTLILKKGSNNCKVPPKTKRGVPHYYHLWTWWWIKVSLHSWKHIPPHISAYMEEVGLINWINENGIKPEVLGGDSTNPNTG